MDHRELDNMVHGLEAIRKTPDPLTTARATAVLNSHLRIHLDKEDVHLYPILRERTTDDEQISIGKIMASKTPSERSPIARYSGSVAIPFTWPWWPSDSYTIMDVGDASTSFHYGQAADKKERFRKLGYVDSADPRTIRQVSARLVKRYD